MNIGRKDGMNIMGVSCNEGVSYMNDVLEKPIVKCEDCGKLYLKFDHIPKPQPCPHCKVDK